MMMLMFGRRPPPEPVDNDRVARLRLLAAELKTISLQLQRQVHDLSPDGPPPQGDRDVRGR